MFGGEAVEVGLVAEGEHEFLARDAEIAGCPSAVESAICSSAAWSPWGERHSRGAQGSAAGVGV